MVKVKICGITSWADAKLAIDAGADALGFNFYPPSPRYIAPQKARRIVSRFPSRVEAIGVFVDEFCFDVQETALEVELNAVQLHGKEPPEDVEELSEFIPVIKAFRVRRGFRPAFLAGYPDAEAYLLDGFSGRLPGGTGASFDWRIAKQAKRYGKIILAGGLVAENVAQAILEVRPFAIDVCSGVESKSGRKDPVRLRELMRAVEAANRQLT